MPTYRINLGYDGSGFHGYARNSGVRTVQGDLEDALGKITGIEIESVVAGRTDAGVHARGQVVSFVVDAELDADRVARSLRSILGPEIAVFDAIEVDNGFDARYSAKCRTYRYSIDDSSVPDPLARSSVWHVAGPLDLDAMNRAAAAFVGSHDFASLCRARRGATTNRTVTRARWERRAALLVYDVEARAFCHQMVRSMVALSVEVGRARVDAEAIPGILEARDRNAARGAAPPHGLILWEVAY